MRLSNQANSQSIRASLSNKHTLSLPAAEPILRHLVFCRLYHLANSLAAASVILPTSLPISSIASTTSWPTKFVILVTVRRSYSATRLAAAAAARAAYSSFLLILLNHPHSIWASADSSPSSAASSNISWRQTSSTLRPSFFDTTSTASVSIGNSSLLPWSTQMC